jgi:SAM-dependent methyltransferase
VMLVPVRGSDCFQVVDGHHRVAAAAVAGETRVAARVRRGSVTTPLQDHLDRMSWIGGKRELYQPVDAPELELSWPTVRRCDDRLELMDKQLADLGIVPEGSTYLDVASAYGWFVSRMAERGFEATGVERDPEAAVLGRAVYGLRPGHIVTADVVDFLHDDPGSWDVVSCFSLLHHFALGRGSVDETALLRLLDRATRRVLFFDTGMAHEAWFRNTLPDWDADHVRDFLETVGTFDRVVDLGPDRDAVAPYADNYRRHLFACIRDE